MSDSLNPMDCSLLGSSDHGILQRQKLLEWASYSFSRIFDRKGSDPSLRYRWIVATESELTHPQRHIHHLEKRRRQARK